MILKNIDSISKYGLTGLMIIVLGLIIWKLFTILDERDKKFLKTIEKFDSTIIEQSELNRSARMQDNEKVAQAVNNIKDVVLAINTHNK